MAEGRTAAAICDGKCPEVRPFGIGAAGWLSLAAAPVFAAMALLAVAEDAGPAAILCASPHGPASASGMVSMYALMSLFHSPPWLTLISRRRRDRTSRDGGTHCREPVLPAPPQM